MLPSRLRRALLAPAATLLPYATAPAQDVWLELPGPQSYQRFGTALDWCGDVDQDGYEDLVVGSSWGGGHGRVAIVSGRNGTTLFERLDNSAVKIGQRLCGPGDLDLDGVPDIFIAGHNGRVYVHSGADGSILWQRAHGDVPVNVAGAGDLDGDEEPDLLVAILYTGALYTGTLRAYSNLSGVVLWEGTDFNECQALGYAMDELGGDLDLDGVGDRVVGTHGNSCDRGEVFVLSGATGAVLREHEGAPGENIGAAVAGLGDVNGDLVPDYAFGGTFLQLPALHAWGLAEVRSGADGALLHRWQGTEYGALMGLSVDGAGDVDGDGAPFGDGLRCAGVGVVRLGVDVSNANGVATWGPGLAAAGGWLAGDTRYFQAWYRDPLDGPCGSGFNLSNAIAVDFDT